MDHAALSVLLVVVLLGVLSFGLWIGFALMAVAAVALLAIGNGSVGAIMSTSVWGHSSLWTLTPLPLFIWMGEILFRTRLSDDMFSGLSPWVGRLPGRLLHVNVLGSGIFAAVSGSSTATCATVGRICLPELMRRGYDERMAIGSLAASGTLGLLIPPSIIMC